MLYNDRFGEEVDTERILQDKFRAKVSISTSRTFYGWVFQFGGQIKIIGPDKVKREYMDMARTSIE